MVYGHPAAGGNFDVVESSGRPVEGVESEDDAKIEVKKKKAKQVEGGGEGA
jgi:hypothetical protein